MPLSSENSKINNEKILGFTKTESVDMVYQAKMVETVHLANQSHVANLWNMEQTTNWDAQKVKIVVGITPKCVLNHLANDVAMTWLVNSSMLKGQKDITVIQDLKEEIIQWLTIEILTQMKTIF